MQCRAGRVPDGWFPRDADLPGRRGGAAGHFRGPEWCMLSRRPRAGDRGSVALWVIIFTFAVLVLVALIVDGGQLMNAKERAADVAEQAARAAANDVNVADLRAGTVPIDPGACATPGGPAPSLLASYPTPIPVPPLPPAPPS